MREMPKLPPSSSTDTSLHVLQNAQESLFHPVAVSPSARRRRMDERLAQAHNAQAQKYDGHHEQQPLVIDLSLHHKAQKARDRYSH
mmetsp:Transcript_81847/g.162516  ORF Transcript_81847/g.162516 Transcript_81847/m.162516 type:complete len:86 (-) Transcript_81847:732-989(-)